MSSIHWNTLQLWLTWHIFSCARFFFSHRVHNIPSVCYEILCNEWRKKCTTSDERKEKEGESEKKLSLWGKMLKRNRLYCFRKYESSKLTRAWVDGTTLHHFFSDCRESKLAHSFIRLLRSHSDAIWRERNDITQGQIQQIKVTLNSWCGFFCIHKNLLRECLFMVRSTFIECSGSPDPMEMTPEQNEMKGKSDSTN